MTEDDLVSKTNKGDPTRERVGAVLFGPSMVQGTGTPADHAVWIDRMRRFIGSLVEHLEARGLLTPEELDRLLYDVARYDPS